MALFRRTRALENEIDDFLNKISEGALAFRIGVQIYAAEARTPAFEEKLHHVKALESTADSLRRASEIKLYSRTLFPESRGDVCRRLDGVEAVYDRYTAASKFLLHPDRIGDMLVTGDINTVFGPLDRKDGIEEMPEGYRTHGGSDEAIAPLIVYNRDVDPKTWREYEYNFDLTKSIGF